MQRLLNLAPFASILAAHEATHAQHAPGCLLGAVGLALVALAGAWYQRFKRTL